ncbi:hypothetical protein [Thermomonas hydrothermalis]|uniref:Uncharacterized protein n=1 Tax=Thermomonas hydrothermalis TaxID=213588 RepID=A0A1M4V6Q1_9GAMM|nr:hypothetical protein [Thermomonas hydrothermalis]MCL6618661.1 hypothetical protein [Thermomonas hydrothermalis]SHE64580.1 hypothetical protein SAMN02745204_00846 [Thermomonas hydrothermalis]
MAEVFDRLIVHNRVFIWIALAAGALLLIPLLAMQFDLGVHWTVGDFLVMGTLLLTAGWAFVLMARRVSARHRWKVGLAVLAVFLYLWAELAVGVLTSLGS